MKNLFIALTFLFTNLVIADSWDDLTKEQAEAVVLELKLNPYIFDYCDCCHFEGAYAAKVRLLKVVKTEIIVCPWEAESFSVNVETIVLAHIPYEESGPNLDQMTSKKKETAIYTVAMNYTWSFNKGQQKAAPIYTSVPYDKYEDKNACRTFFVYPTPEQGKGIIKDGAYKKWWKKNLVARL